MLNRMRAVALLLAVFVAAGASAQMRGKRGGRPETKSTQRESIDLFYATSEELRADLKLTEVQTPLWEAYVRKVVALKEDMAQQRARARSDGPRRTRRMRSTASSMCSATGWRRWKRSPTPAGRSTGH